MVSAEELGSAYTLAGLQMDVSGIIGPMLSALLLPLAAAKLHLWDIAVGAVRHTYFLVGESVRSRSDCDRIPHRSGR
jgi:hypothetical protein